MEEYEGSDETAEADTDLPPFTAKFWVKVNTVDELKEWCIQYNMSSHTNMTLRDSRYPKKGVYIAYFLRECRFSRGRDKRTIVTKTDNTRKREDIRTNCTATCVCKLYKESKFGNFNMCVTLIMCY